MTSVEKYKRNLKRLVEKYEPKVILDVGVEKGVSTKIFLDSRWHYKAFPKIANKIIVHSIDIENCVEVAEEDEYWRFRQGDASVIIPKFERWAIYFDLIYLDALYTKERLEHDVPICWKLLNEGGALVFNEYVDMANHRKGEVREWVNQWTYDNDLDFYVMPNRAGMAVVEK